MSPLLHRVLTFLFSVTLAGYIFLPNSSAQTLQIDALKANYLHGFLDFVDWTENPNTSTITIGVFGSHELVYHLNESIAHHSNEPKPLILAVKDQSEIPAVDLLFISTGQKLHWPKLFELAKANDILLVGEEEGFREAGGAIEFIIRKNRLRFLITPKNAKNCGINVSSKLIDISIKDE